MSRFACVVVFVAVALASASAPGRSESPCGDPGVSAATARETLRVLRSGRDVWGDALLRSARGPTYESARRFLGPLLYARAPRRRPLTESGAYYVPIADPPEAAGADAVALHVADGSQILWRRVGGPSLTVLVGARSDERFGSCLGRLVPARLRGGYLPILETGYTDATGGRYRQESFTTRPPGAPAPVTFVGLTIAAGAGGATVRFAAPPSPSSSARVPEGAADDVYVAWGRGTPRLIGRAAYLAARETLARRWRSRLSAAMQIDMPERVVMDAQRALLVQDLLLGWRYSFGNAYEEFSYPESPDVAQVMGEEGFADVERAILETSFTRRPTPFPNWKRGERLLVSAAHVRRFGDLAFLRRATPTLAGFVAALGRDVGAGKAALLGPERYSADIPDLVRALHGQAVAWAGLRAIASVWAANGYASLAAEARGLAFRLERGLRDAVRRSERRLADGSLFVPARLLAGEAPYRSLVQARLGSYWNLVMPFALSTGFLAPGSADARGVLNYMLLHGSRLLGLVRAGAYALYGRDAPFPVSGTDEVYGVNVARFLADNDEADQLVLSLYGELAAAMTPGTFVSGEGASVAPLEGARYRAMYLPPNAASNAAYLETLRLLLVHETFDARGEPLGLQLAFATPRMWLRAGARVGVRRAPTSFGPVSFTIDVDPAVVRIRVDVPRRVAHRRLAVRLRLPSGARIRSVRLGGRPFDRFDAASGTIDLSGRPGRLDLEVRYSG